jgi:hypothetical protein
VLFVAKKNRGRRRNGGGRDDQGCWLGHKLYITDGFTNGFN